MTKKLSNEEKKLNNTIFRRCNKFRKFIKSDFNDEKSQASLLLSSYLECSKDMSHLFKFLSKMDIYLNKTYNVTIETSNKTLHLNKTVDDFIDNFDTYKLSIFTVYQQELEDFISGDCPKGFTHYEAIKPKIEELFDINNETIIKKLAHFDYIKKEKIYKTQIEEWFLYYNFYREIERFILENSTINTDNQDRKDQKKIIKESITAYSLLKDAYFNKNLQCLVFLPEFLDNYDKRSKHLNQVKKLMSYEFPNMTPAIANKIVITPHPTKIH